MLQVLTYSNKFNIFFHKQSLIQVYSTIAPSQTRSLSQNNIHINLLNQLNNTKNLSQTLQVIKTTNPQLIFNNNYKTQYILAIINKCNTEKRWNLAYLLYNHSIKHYNLNSYSLIGNRIIHTLINNHKYTEMYSIFKHMKGQNYLNIYSYLTILKGYKKNNDIEKCYLFYQFILKSNIINTITDTDISNYILNLLIELDKYDDTISLFNTLNSINMIDITSFLLIINLYIDNYNDDYTTALTYYQKMKEKGHNSDLIELIRKDNTYNNTDYLCILQLLIHTNNTTELMYILNTLIHNNIHSIQIYGIIITNYININKSEQALNIYNIIKKYNIPINNIDVSNLCLYLLLETKVKGHNSDPSSDLIVEAINLFNTSRKLHMINDISIAYIMMHYSENNNIQAALDMYYNIFNNDNIQITSVRECNIILIILIQYKQYIPAYKFFQNMCYNNIVNSWSYISMMSPDIVSHLTTSQIKIDLNRSRSPTSQTYTSQLPDKGDTADIDPTTSQSTTSQLPPTTDIDLIMTLYNDMKHRNISIENEHREIIINMLTKANRLDEVEIMKQIMIMEGEEEGEVKFPE